MYKIIPSLIAAFNSFDPNYPLFADTETCGFYNKIRLVQLYQKGAEHVLMVEWPDPIMLASLLSAFDSKWHNAHYDITTVQAQSNTRWIPDKFDDTFLLARLHFYKEAKFSLDETFKYTLGFCPYTKLGLNKQVLQKSDWDVPTLSEDQLLYAACDVKYMPELWDKVKGCVADPSYRLDMHTLRHCLDFQWNGMPTDSQAIYDAYQKNVADFEELDLPVNCNSPKQVTAWLGIESSTKYVLCDMYYRQGVEQAGDVSKARSLLKMNTFLAKYETPDGRVYGKFLPSARSGRLTSKDDNLQQVPNLLKCCFQAPKGRKFYYADYAQLELRTICAIVRCIAMAKLFREGTDLHQFTADMIDAVRDLAKTYNFNLLYGGGIGMIIKMLILRGTVLEPEMAAKHKRKWKSLWKEIARWQDRKIADFNAGRAGKTPLGRKYMAKMMTDQMNIENQGAGAEVAKLALHFLMPKLKAYSEEHSCEVFLCDFIHDSFIVEAPEGAEHHEPISVMIAESMQDAWFEMSKLYKIKDLPMPVDVKVGSNWGDIENDIYDYKFELEGMALWNESTYS